MLTEAMVTLENGEKKKLGNCNNKFVNKKNLREKKKQTVKNLEMWAL